MPSFTVQAQALQADGPNVKVVITPPRKLLETLVKAGKPIPKPEVASAQVDTGASGTVFRRDIFTRMGLSPVGSIQIMTPSTDAGGSMTCDVFHIDVHLQSGPKNSILIQDIFAVAAPMGGQKIEGLIGRDILKHGVLIYTGYMNQFTISF